MTSRIPLVLAAVLVLGLALVGCMEYSAKPSPAASAQPVLIPQESGSSGSMASASPTPSASPAAGDSGSSYMDESTSQGVDSTGSDIEELESFSDDLAAGDVEYSDDAG